jgi:hypothetical protein
VQFRASKFVPEMRLQSASGVLRANLRHSELSSGIRANSGQGCSASMMLMMPLCQSIDISLPEGWFLPYADARFVA